MKSRPIYTKRHQVAKLFLGDLMAQNRDAKKNEIEWTPIEKLPRKKACYLIWAKNTGGDIFMAFVFGDMQIYYADECAHAWDITHFSYIGD
jgi:hypothetical protein